MKWRRRSVSLKLDKLLEFAEQTMKNGSPRDATCVLIVMRILLSFAMNADETLFWKRAPVVETILETSYFLHSGPRGQINLNLNRTFPAFGHVMDIDYVLD